MGYPLACRSRWIGAAREASFAVVGACVLMGGAHAWAQQDLDTKEVAPPPPYVEDIKTTWVPPPTLDKPPPEAADEQPAAAPARQARAKGSVEEVVGRLLIDPLVVHFDEPGDGALWAKGSTYKARFDALGATYIPFFGSDAPRNYPVSFNLVSAHVGEQEIVYLEEVEPSRDGLVVTYDRGGVTELYELSPLMMEQMFLFDELPAAGDLTVRIAIDTELAMEEKPDGFRFSGNRGYVGYSRALVTDAAGRVAPVPTVWAAGAIKITVPELFLREAVFPVIIDPVIVTFSINSADEDDRWPDVAYDLTTHRFLAVWEDSFSESDGDVWAQLHDATTGALIDGSGAYIDFTTDNWRRPKVANNRIAANFLVVAEEGIFVPPFFWRAISGRIRSASSTLMGCQIGISSLSGDKRNPDVGGDPHPVPPTHYFVVWERVVSLNSDHDVHAQLVNATSTLFGAVMLIDNSGSTLDRFPSVSKTDGNPPATTQEWTIVWQRQFSPSDQDIRGAQIHWDGTVTHPSFSIDFSNANHEQPTVSSLLDAVSGTRDYLVAYEAGGDIRARVLNGTAHQDTQNLTAMGAFLVGQDQILPSADSDGDSSFVVAASELFSNTQEDYDVYIASLCWDGSNLSLAEGHQNMAFSPAAETQVEIASVAGGGGSGLRYMAIWSDIDAANSFGDIEGGLYDTAVVPCPWDCGGDNNDDVGITDFLTLLAQWGGAGSCDFDGGGVSINDFLDLLANWGPCP